MYSCADGVIFANRLLDLCRGLLNVNIPMLPATPFNVCASLSANSRSPCDESFFNLGSCVGLLCSELLQQAAIEAFVSCDPSQPPVMSTPSMFGNSRSVFFRCAGLVAWEITGRWFGPSRQRGEQGVGIDGLSDMVDHAGLYTALALFDERVGRHRDDRANH